ncbi:hypothetical protein [Paenibacillus lautus]|uniref:hypothetical protein n=1 Tax=Paenibacillus lautus TaxID=1401 RepID=UPI001C7CF7EC|nr:hypothetical protein [Paenibacillus lautus]MBX4152270.1 hypothetical protein [Paenibacillus lautus]
MSLNLNGWDMEDVNERMQGKTLFEIINIYKEIDNLIVQKSLEYVQAVSDKSELAKERIENDFNHLEKEKCVVAIRISDEMSKVSK